MSDIFKNEFVPNIQSHNRTDYKQWKLANPGEAAKWEKYRDDLIAGKKPSPPVLATKYGRALVAGGKMSVTDIGSAPPPVTPIGDKFASPSGSDSNPGTLAAPYKTYVKLMNSLSPGQVGMLRAGNYGSSTVYPGDVNNGGTAANPITLTNYPGESATIVGYVGIIGSGWTIRNLHFDSTNNIHSAVCGTQALGIVLGGSDIIFENNEIYQTGPYKGSGILGGRSGANTGHRNIIRNNLIHDIGYCQNLDHGVYLGFGQDVQIYGNWFWTNSHGWGFQLYPEAVRALVHSNVVVGFGSGAVISDNGSPTTFGCDVYNNVFANMVALDSSTTGFHSNGAGLSGSGAQPGTNNKFRDNCVFACADGVGSASNIIVTGNVTSDPQFVDAASRDYRVQNPAFSSWGLPTSRPGPDV